MCNRPEKRKATSGKVAPLEMISLAAIENPENRASLTDRQAFRLRSRFPIASWQLARVVAELAFNTEARA